MNDLINLFIISALLIMVLIGLIQSNTATGILLTFTLLCITCYFIIYHY
jgi:hypothetical protein